MSRTKYSFKRHQELQHKPPASPVFHRYRAPLPTPRALTGLAQPQQAPISGAGGQQGSLSPCKDPIQAPALTTAMASSLFLQLLQLRSPQGHRCSCGFFLGTSQREGALTSTRERGRRGTGCRGGCCRLHHLCGGGRRLFETSSAAFLICKI